MKKINIESRPSLLILGSFVISLIILLGVYLMPFNLRVPLFKVIALVLIVFILYPFCKVNIKWILYYFFCLDRDWWIARIERPRIFIYIIYFGVLAMMLKDISISNQYVLFFYRLSIMFYLVVGAAMLGKLVWTKKFESALLPEIKNLVNQNISIRKLSETEIKEIIRMNSKNIEESSENDLQDLLNGKIPGDKIKWVGTSGKNVITYTELFSLVHLISESGDIKFDRAKRKSLMNFIITNFVKYEKGEISHIPYGSLNSAYTNFIL
ncbi:hypothetical protein NAL32_17605 [Chryseobacterium sp. Ch-15]|uniref:Uncharacterized protein n=1 Tax=Chryseobacterium muglaense TaxID=2893752 RepID=A0A9Q3YUT0_9FLAO|nr:hypothetical protein [Chryseobacterium muglaense]MBD3906495.1 hypothetical protein [Chryseobacterium muglaense]MCC9034000.1 hypothetical protein [Chryseobacterium muglaense]MCM2556203.1 hypothetical protein [Chryseobacterium muglaense]